jgi:hypothetical protein
MIRATSARPCRASPSSRCSPASTSTPRRHQPRPHLQLRRHRRELRGARLRGRRLRLAVRQELAQEDLAQRPAADAATRTVVEALYDAADDDSATGGPDPVRRLYPIVYRVDAEGAVRLTDAEVAAVADAIVTDRAEADRANTSGGPEP